MAVVTAEVAVTGAAICPKVKIVVRCHDSEHMLNLFPLMQHISAKKFTPFLF